MDRPLAALSPVPNRRTPGTSTDRLLLPNPQRRFAYETIPGSKKKGDKADTNKYVLGMSLTTKDVSKKSAKEEDSSADE